MRMDGWDVVAMVGVLTLSAGVWLVAGIGWALIALGAQLLGISVLLPVFAPHRSAK